MGGGDHYFLGSKYHPVSANLAGKSPDLLEVSEVCCWESHRPDKCSMFCNSTGTFPFIGGLNHSPVCPWSLLLLLNPTALYLRLVQVLLGSVPSLVEPKFVHG